MIDKEKIIQEYLPYIKRIAYDLKKNLPHNIEIDDLIQEGLIGLLQAIERYNPKKGAKLRSYILTRVKGAMYDYLRKIDWMPKNLRHDVKVVEDAISKMENSGKIIDFNEISKITNLPLENVKRAYNEMVRKQFLMLDDYLTEDLEINETISSSDYTPEETAFKEIIKEELKKAINKLDEKEKIILNLRFEHELSLKEIGKILNLTESRVSQILSSIILKLKKMLGG
ncbi:RNA polymerase sigma70 [Thermosipho melanesiensis]|uniref:RNA polymerase, sigma 28 subunit, FliA/WhiG n=2 Tax=Thermosipho melanesiensis TaxID=46541 RepID=A6LMX7_THEM4|nr:FliA/WhiG family RNA polymerase sigma factor [Thermosipho melanesiensis]ABR31278.1 RNA polymerase, sigma 28 subunit, FliA/WhiG [Thermosipho melanesiensis BI429]APT74358.1 RNA polymerase sigma70 [Thermosipho melanesiensis]OOC36301.1 RNA polymerase sigma70 [Thermosipho melanesiensis]OOC37119.1 RNA polymerase sigma70 [Thermosipho melanesiensis]OOC37871.1 RNA polymerase sigma70 [Thermosipho melanesiensis]